MAHQSYGQLLFNAVRETLETMAFAEVIPYSFQIGNEDFSCLDDETEQTDSPSDNSGIHAPIQTDFSHTDQGASSASSEASFGTWGVTVGTQPVAVPDDTWSETNTLLSSEEDAWGMPPPEESESGSDWGVVPSLHPADPWGGGGQKANSFVMKASEFDFKKLVDNQEDWCWSCLRVNSQEIHSVWFIVSKALAFELAQNMYAGEEEPTLDSPLIRDLIAELTNVLGGRLMLLLEERGEGFTLTVPDIGVGLPTMPDFVVMESVLCKVLADGEFPVMAFICFNKTEE